jgi:hypothetical protein
MVGTLSLSSGARSRDPLALPTLILPDGQITDFLSSPSCKNISVLG